MLVCHDFPLAQNLSKEAKVLDPLLQYSLRKLSDFKSLLGKEASFPQSSHYKYFLQNKLKLQVLLCAVESKQELDFWGKNGASVIVAQLKNECV